MNARAFVIAITTTTLLTGCGKKKAPEAGASKEALTQRVIEKVLPDQGLVLVEIDLNADGRPEIFNFYRERTDAPRLLIRKETDLNADGQVDVISYFDAEGGLEKEESDGDFDGRFDMTDYFKGGRRVMAEWDSDYDGRPNVFRYYQANTTGAMRITHEERDTDGNGQVDFWIRFDGDGNVIKTGADTDGDGKMDMREE
jgi:hypothetical protein